ncbi:MAG TPA: circularly permuted type 2 ATP-grasp protein [Candidatus Acidoferrales bacterium]
MTASGPSPIEEHAGHSAAGAPASAAEYWNSLLRSDVELQPPYCANLATQMRERKLTFGDRIHCPFLRPFFLDERDEARVRAVAETIAGLGERVVQAALASKDLLEQLGLRPEEERLARIEPGYATASTASRLDAFLLPNSLEFAEYNAESPAGLGYSHTLSEVFSELEVMSRFREAYSVRSYPLMESILTALMASYRDWGGTSKAPQIAIVDWRGVPTWSEFEILQARFENLGVPTMICDPRDLEFDGKSLKAQGRKIDFVYRRVLINDMIARPAECDALLRAYESRAVCVANTLQCKIPHKKAFFAVLTDERNREMFNPEERELIRRHIPWTRLVGEIRTTRAGETIDLLAHIRQHRENFVLKPNDEYGGAGVMLGWETDPAAWDAAIERAVKDGYGTWVVQEKIAVRREVFPFVEAGNKVVMKDMLVDLAPYLFRGKLSGFLTRLSSTGLANVTSGGGQIPAFAVKPLTQ